MAEFKVRTKGNADPHGKSRVYFCCHPDDFDRYFDRICEDVFKTQDCAIYYTPDMTEPLDEANIEVDLGRMNLFLVPVSFRLMNEPCRAMTVDIAYAKDKNILILPFMMEPNLDAIYALPKNFGERQYLNPCSTDMTEIKYEEKLKKILSTVLISDEMAKRVRAEFDAHIFLSYRKKDRAYANQLMRIIHKIDGCRDIAIWYDEFLTPGESFIQNIEKAMSESKLFALLVTPNLLEDGNFVMTTEYPAARDAGMDILPSEAEDTNRDELYAKFDGIPEPVKTYDDGFADSLLSMIQKIAINGNDDDPEHNFLIGLAYLDGIDVEVNVERGIELITKAAEADLPEAMEKLYNMYLNGDNVQLDYHKALKWARRIVDFYTKEYGEEHPDTLTSLDNLAIVYGKLGEDKKALELYKRVYELSCKILGEEHLDTLTFLNNLASTYEELGKYKKALELNKRGYELSCKIFGEEHPDTLTFLNNLASTYMKFREDKKALELHKKVYELRCKILGEEHPDTLTTINNIACAYGNLGEYKKALELIKRGCELSYKILGEKHPNTLASINNLAIAYGNLREYKKAVELHKKVYGLRCKIFGEEHPDTLTSLSNLAFTHGRLGYYAKALQLHKKIYGSRCKTIGEEHPDILDSLNNLAFIYIKLRKYAKALELHKKVYGLRCKIFGEEHPDILDSLNNLAFIYMKLRKYENALKLHKKVYELSCKIVGEEHPDTLVSLSNLAFIYMKLKKYAKSLELLQKVYELRRKILGEEHPDTIGTRQNIEILQKLINGN